MDIEWRMKGKCQHEDCDRPRVYAKHCCLHYRRILHSGDPDKGRGVHIAKRLWKYVKKGGPDECWNWIGLKRPHGYGRTSIKGKSIDAHRASWLIHNGEIPDGMCVLHKCDNPSCVNPAHLFLGTHLDNTLDMFSKGRANCPPRKVSHEQVREIKRLRAENRTSHKDLADQFGISRALVCCILRGKRRTHNALPV